MSEQLQTHSFFWITQISVLHPDCRQLKQSRNKVGSSDSANKNTNCKIYIYIYIYIYISAVIERSIGWDLMGAHRKDTPFKPARSGGVAKSFCDGQV